MESAFGTAGVEIDALQAIRHAGVQERVLTQARGVELGGDLGAAATAEAPGGMCVLGKELVFERADGRDVGPKPRDELLELLFLACEDHEVLGAETMTGVVAGGGSLAFGGAGSGRIAGVCLVCGDLGGGSHGLSPF